MKRNMKILAAALLFAALVLSITLPGDIRDAEAIEEKGSCTFRTVLDTDKYALELADVTVDLYRVAVAHSIGEDNTSFSLEAVEPFTGLDLYNGAGSASALINLGQQAGRIALHEGSTLTPAYSAEAGRTIMGIDAGMYLVVLRPTDTSAEYVDTDADGDLITKITKRVAVENPPEGYPDYRDYTYTFLPALVTMPYTDGNGSLVYQVNLLPKVKENTGTVPLHINKRLTEFVGSATVTFSITCYDENGEQVGDVLDVSIAFTDGATLSKTLDINLPENVVRIRVEETYAGAGYQLATGYAQYIETVLNPDGTTTVNFVNEPTPGDTHREGGSVTNHFTRDSDGEWNLIQIYNQP